MITKQVINATALLKELKTNPGVKLKDFCLKSNISKPLMEQIGRKLVAEKIILSKRGPGGGYTLAREEVTLSALVKIFKTIRSKEDLVVKAMAALETINVLN